MASVFWIFEATIKEGKVDALMDIVSEMTEATKANEPGTLIYEWTISSDNRTGQVHERYIDSDAALTHLATFNANFAERLMTLIEPSKMTIYGDASEALKNELSGANPAYMKVVAGFAR